MAESSQIVASLLAFYLIFVMPLFGPWRYRRFQRRMARGLDGRVRYYRWMIATQWLRLMLVGIVAFLGAVPLSMFGLDVPDYGWLWSQGIPVSSPWVVTFFLLVVFGLLALLGAVLTRRRLERPGQINRYRQLQNIKDLLPHTVQERYLWLLVSVSAGICEEIVYRGFLPWYFLRGISGLQTTFFWGVVLSTIIFALAHSYQGLKGVIGTAMLGALLAYLYFITDSLLASIILHAFLDMRILWYAPTILRLTSQYE